MSEPSSSVPPPAVQPGWTTNCVAVRVASATSLKTPNCSVSAATPSAQCAAVSTHCPPGSSEPLHTKLPPPPPASVNSSRAVPLKALGTPLNVAEGSMRQLLGALPLAVAGRCTEGSTQAPTSSMRCHTPPVPP
jgi:hypothetical protein